jgi:hypothetical protein
MYGRVRGKENSLIRKMVASEVQKSVQRSLFENVIHKEIYLDREVLQSGRIISGAIKEGMLLIIIVLMMRIGSLLQKCALFLEGCSTTVSFFVDERDLSLPLITSTYQKTSGRTDNEKRFGGDD